MDIKMEAIRIDEIQSILEKYSISHTNLNRLLGWGKGVIYGYLKGTNPCEKNGNELKKLLNIENMEDLLEKKKNFIDPSIYIKVKETIKQLKNKRFREQKNIIQTKEVALLLERYSISSENLSRLLGWGRGVIYGYLKGTNPCEKNGNELKKLLNIENMEDLLEKKKNCLHPSIYIKVKKTINKLKNKMHNIENIEKLLMKNKNCIPPEDYIKIKNAINML